MVILFPILYTLVYKPLERQTNRGKTLEQQLAEEQTRLNIIIGMSIDAIICADEDGKIVFWNRGAKNIFGYQEEEMIGQAVTNLMPRRFWEPHTNGLNAVKTTGKTHYTDTIIELVGLVKGDQEVPLEASLASWVTGNKRYFCSVLRDISKRKEDEKNLREAMQMAEQANQAKSMFLANMSHEIRTPMNAITGMAYLLMQTDITTKQQRYLDKIDSAAWSLVHIIDDILDFSKINAGKLKMEMAHFDLDSVIDQLSDTILAEVDGKKIEIIFSIPPDIPRALIGDATRLGQVLANLCTNAIKFTEHGEIVIGAKLLEDHGYRATLCFSVRDSGIGMSSEQTKRLFEPFHQADNSTTRQYGGAGLGLSICRKIVEMMDGHITITAEPEKGTCVVFTVCLSYSKQTIEQRFPVSTALQGMRILVVDDNTSCRNILQDILTVLPFDCTAVNSGKAAVEELERVISTVEKRYSLMLIDWSMPDMDGIETIISIQSQQQLLTIPTILMVSAGDQDEIVNRAAGNLELAGFIKKPINTSTLFNTIIDTFGKRQQNNGHLISTHRSRTIDWEAIRGTNILVVDDFQDNLEIMQNILARHGVHVTFANNGQQAVTIVTNGAQKFDAILMDVQMPVMGGITATRRIRDHAQFKALPIIAMTASAMVEDVNQCLASGMNGHIAKPINLTELCEKLVACISLQTKIPIFSDDMTGHSADTIIPAQSDHLHCIDTTAALQRIGDNQTLYRKLLLIFLKNQTDATANIQRSINASDFKAARITAHGMKSAAANIGAMELSNAATELDHCLAVEEQDNLQMKMNCFEECLGVVIIAIKSMLKIT